MNPARVLEVVRAALPERFCVLGPDGQPIFACDFVVMLAGRVWRVWLLPEGHQMDDGPDLDSWEITRFTESVSGNIWRDDDEAGAEIASSILASEAADASKPDRDALRKRLRAQVRQRLKDAS